MTTKEEKTALVANVVARLSDRLSYVAVIIGATNTLYRVDGNGRVTKINDAFWMPNYETGRLLCIAPSQEHSHIMFLPVEGKAYLLVPKQVNGQLANLHPDALMALDALAPVQ